MEQRLYRVDERVERHGVMTLAAAYAVCRGRMVGGRVGVECLLCNVSALQRGGSGWSSID